VRLHAVDQYGKGLGSVSVLRFAKARGGVDYAARFENGEAKGIPIGEYDVGIRAGGVSFVASVSVHTSHVFAVLSPTGMFIGSLYFPSVEYGPGGAPVLKGRIKGIPVDASRPIWVRIFRLYPELTSDCCRTAEIAEDGSFSVEVYNAGQYLVVVLDDAGTLFNGVLRLSDPDSDVELDVKSGEVKVTPRIGKGAPNH
jgi:hypothetical protein